MSFDPDAHTVAWDKRLTERQILYMIQENEFGHGWFIGHYLDEWNLTHFFNKRYGGKPHSGLR